MSLEENKTIVRKFIEAYNNRNLDVFDDLLTPDYYDHTSQVGPEGLKQLMNMAFKAFTDFHETIEDIIAEGDKVWVRCYFYRDPYRRMDGNSPYWQKDNN